MLFFLMIVIVFALLPTSSWTDMTSASACSRCSSRMPPAAARWSRSSGTSGTGTKRGILLAMGLWACFPDAYATALPGLYIPLLVMIFALIFRGFSVEMTLHRAVSDRTWTRLFGVGSLVAAFAQGVLFGGLLCGITVHDQRFAGATWDFFGHGYAVLTGLVTVALFCLAGAAMLQAKTGGALRDQMAGLVRRLTPDTVWGVTLVGRAAPGRDERAAAPRRGGPLAPIRLRSAGGGRGILHRLLAGRPDARPDPVPRGERRRDRRPSGAGRPVLPPDRAAVGDAVLGRGQPQHLGLHGHRDRRVRASHDRLSRLRQLGFPRAPAAGRTAVPGGRPAARRLYPVRGPTKEATDMETNTAGTPDGTADGSARREAGDRKWPRAARLLVAVLLLPVGRRRSWCRRTRSTSSASGSARS